MCRGVPTFAEGKNGVNDINIRHVDLFRTQSSGIVSKSTQVTNDFVWAMQPKEYLDSRRFPKVL